MQQNLLLLSVRLILLMIYSQCKCMFGKKILFKNCALVLNYSDVLHLLYVYHALGSQGVDAFPYRTGFGGHQVVADLRDPIPPVTIMGKLQDQGLDCLLIPVTHGPLCPPLTHGPQADLPYKNRADLPESRELRANGIAALSLRVS